MALADYASKSVDLTGEHKVRPCGCAKNPNPYETVQPALSFADLYPSHLFHNSVGANLVFALSMFNHPQSHRISAQ